MINWKRVGIFMLVLTLISLLVAIYWRAGIQSTLGERPGENLHIGTVLSEVESAVSGGYYGTILVSLHGVHPSEIVEVIVCSHDMEALEAQIILQPGKIITFFQIHTKNGGWAYMLRPTW
jgi:hypothetical protein